ncbi:transcription initiation factor TFIID subunit 4b-like isoform X3 [Juglans microcarpa x Juglans regia]|uniref:transcription initiation factor TFIID subunit 4b-like isoform X3 n=1 Tax=Juglans microcarpa x Juglans regia TaxID=2249226 RepID=UPI001B7F0186|nr:transcription initiation factor TFIID subunit 4b-like isoform X3 [Juglans microcarpa x Juglans regia]
MSSTQLNGTTQGINTMGTPKFQRQNSINDLKRVQGGSVSHLANSSTSQHILVPRQSSTNKEQSSTPSPSTAGVKQESLDQVTEEQHRPHFLHLHGLSSHYAAQLEQENVASGIYMDEALEKHPSRMGLPTQSDPYVPEEEEQLFSVTKEDSQVSEASRRVVQEEEERLILQKAALQKKLAEIVAKCGLKSISNDVERCLSLCVEERVRGLLSNLIRLSKQRDDIEKPRHRTVITSDVRHQIMTMNKKAREKWEKKQAEAERLRRLDEPEGNNGLDGEKDKDEGRAKSIKANKEEDDKTRTTAANLAALAAVGGDDMLSRWQLMAEQARQKCEGGMNASGSQPGKDASCKPLSTSVPPPRKAGAVKKSGRNQIIVPQTKVARNISIKDVIAVLEREPQMSRSSLYERIALMASLSK